MAVPHVGPQSAECRACLSDSAVDLDVNCHCVGEGAAKICKLVHCLQLLSLHCDGGLLVLGFRSWLVHHFGFLCVDEEAKVVTCCSEFAHVDLHFLL